MTPVDLKFYCSFCKNPTMIWCSHCFTPYCDRKCQYFDRKKHLLECISPPPLIKITALDEVLNLDCQEAEAAYEDIQTQKMDLQSINPTQMPPLTAIAFENDQVKIVDMQSARTVYRIKDLESIQLRTGRFVPILVSDVSRLKDFYISAMNYENQLGESLMKLDDYCRRKQDDIEGDFKPQVNELCLAISESDGQWYRACRLDKSAKRNFSVKFIDFGKIDRVWRGVVMPLDKSLLYPIYTNRCRIVNIKKKHVEKLRKFFEKERTLIVDLSYNRELKVYDILINDLEKILR